jgi:hypothetical protein
MYRTLRFPSIVPRFRCHTGRFLASSGGGRKAAAGFGGLVSPLDLGRHIGGAFSKAAAGVAQGALAHSLAGWLAGSEVQQAGAVVGGPQCEGHRVLCHAASSPPPLVPGWPRAILGACASLWAFTSCFSGLVLGGCWPAESASVWSRTTRCT